MASQIAGLGATEGAASIAIAQPRLRQAVYLVPLTNGTEKVTGPEATTKRLRFHSTSAVATHPAFTQSAPLNLLPMAGTHLTTSGPMKKAHTKRTVGAAARAFMIRLPDPMERHGGNRHHGELRGFGFGQTHPDNAVAVVDQ